MGDISRGGSFSPKEIAMKVATHSTSLSFQCAGEYSMEYIIESYDLRDQF